VHKPQRRYWLVKSEPEDFSFDDLLRSKGRRTTWGGVRNFQARNLMRDQMQPGDGVLFYHSSAEPTGIVGLARVASSRSARSDAVRPRSEYHDPKSPRAAPRWVAVEIEAPGAAPALPDARGAARRARAGPRCWCCAAGSGSRSSP
jgi:predicted RNA-binding protein with PUA-like domain